MDLILGFPRNRFHRDSIFIMVDRLTKVAHFILGNDSDDAIIISQKFMKEVFKLYGFPKNVVSDHENKFTLEFW